MCVLDGWGWRPEQTANAIALAKTPAFDHMIRNCPNSLLKTSGMDVGLPNDQMGNSEVGHLNLGAGRIVNQDTQRIDTSITSGKLEKIPALVSFIKELKETKGTCHLMGLISDGGVHSHQRQIETLASIISNQGVPVAVHAILDGRDTPPRTAIKFIDQLENTLSKLKNINITTVCGRFYCMDRDQRWDRVELAYQCMVQARGKKGASAISAVENSYQSGTGDEFIEPTVIADYKGMQEGDGLLMANFRADRAREILSALLDPGFSGFEREKTIKFCDALGLVEYSTELNDFMKTLFPPEDLKNIFAEILAKSGMKQLRIAETEKYAHVTFFFNGGKEEPFDGEERVLVPSPKVTTYDQKPEMSAREVTEILAQSILDGSYDFIFVNFANPDMVGHTGLLEPAIKAIETVDECLGKIRQSIEHANGVLLVTADHGNAETMLDPHTGTPFTSHTTNAVPAILVNAPEYITGLRNGRLADVAPTLLELLKLDKPEIMTGTSLIVPAHDEGLKNKKMSLSAAL